MPTALELTRAGWKSYIAAARERTIPEPTPAERDARERLLSRIREAAAAMKSRFGARRVILTVAQATFRVAGLCGFLGRTGPG